MRKILCLILLAVFCVVIAPTIGYSQTGKWGGDLPTIEDVRNTYETLKLKPLSDDVCPAHVRHQGAGILVQLFSENLEIADEKGNKRKVTDVLKGVKQKELEEIRLQTVRDMAIIYTDLIRHPDRYYKYPIRCANLHGELLSTPYGGRAMSFNSLDLKNILETAEHLEWLFQDKNNKSAFLNSGVEKWSNKPLIMDETELRESVKQQAKEIVSQIQIDSKGKELINISELSVWTLQMVLTTFWIPPGEIGLSFEQARKIVRDGDFSAIVVTSIRN